MNIIETAMSHVGKSREELKLNKSTEWCAEEASNIIELSDILEGAKQVQSISCNDMYTAMCNSPYWVEPEDYPKSGDFAFFDWNREHDGGKPLDHVGVVVEVIDRFKVKTVEGNTQNDAGVNDGVVHLKVRELHPNVSSYPDRYMRYIGRSITTPGTAAEMTEEVKTLRQNLQDLNNKIEKIKKILDN